MTVPSPETAAADPPLAALRAEIDRLDDALHDLLMRRAAVVAEMAQSRAKAPGTPLRPGREALILRRLLARHQGPLPRAALVRLWREVFASSTLMQGGFVVAVQARGPEQERVARDHFGSRTPVRLHQTGAAALADVTTGRASVAALPLPQEAEPAEAAWWTRLDAPRLQVVARLPFLAGAEPAHEMLAVAALPPDPTGEDRSLLRLEAARPLSRTAVQKALAAAGLKPRNLMLRSDAGLTRVLLELDGALAADDPRLKDLPFDRATPLGFYAVPERGD
jgi:chorismate mutase